MTENKQYYIIQDNLGEYSVLKGKNMELICPEIEHKEIAELFCYELNDLAEENEQLKQRIIELKKEVNDLSNGEADWLIEEDL